MRWLSTVLLMVAAAAAQAQVQHVEDLDVVAQVTPVSDNQFICIVNDGVTTGSLADCPGIDQPADDGLFLLVAALWGSTSTSGINACGSAIAVPVSAADCPLDITGTEFAACVANEWVLVQTTKSGRYFAVQANNDCTLVAAIQPCRKNDRFDPASGCTPTASPPELAVESGYVKPTVTLGLPPAADCDEGSEAGRLRVEPVDEVLYVCAQAGWKAIPLGAPP